MNTHRLYHTHRRARLLLSRHKPLSGCQRSYVSFKWTGARRNVNMCTHTLSHTAKNNKPGRVSFSLYKCIDLADGIPEYWQVILSISTSHNELDLTDLPFKFSTIFVSWAISEEHVVILFVHKYQTVFLNKLKKCYEGGHYHTKSTLMLSGRAAVCMLNHKIWDYLQCSLSVGNAVDSSSPLFLWMKRSSSSSYANSSNTKEEVRQM